MKFVPTPADALALERALSAADFNDFIPGVQGWYRDRLTPSTVAVLIAYTQLTIDQARRVAIDLAIEDWMLLGISKETFARLDALERQVDDIAAINAAALARAPDSMDPDPQWYGAVVAPLVYGEDAAGTRTGPPLFTEGRTIARSAQAGVDRLDEAARQLVRDLKTRAEAAVTIGAGIGAGVLFIFGGLVLARSQGWIR